MTSCSPKVQFGLFPNSATIAAKTPAFQAKIPEMFLFSQRAQRVGDDKKPSGLLRSLGIIHFIQNYLPFHSDLHRGLVDDGRTILPEGRYFCTKTITNSIAPNGSHKGLEGTN